MGFIREKLKSEVRGQLEEFRVAIETMNKRIDSLEMNNDWIVLKGG